MIKEVKVVCEEAYAQSIWCKVIFEGLVKELKKRRISYEQTEDLEEILKETGVCLIGAGSEWLKQQVFLCNEKHCCPVILSARAKMTVPGDYHLICADLGNVKKTLYETLEKANRKKIALYGINGKVDLDKDYGETFLEAGKVDLFPTTGNLEGCFRNFKNKASTYDAVICINGYAAISLVKKMEKECEGLLEEMAILSFEEVLKHSKYSQWISRVDLNLEAYGKTAWTVMELASEREEISGMTVKIKGDVSKIQKKNEQTDAEEVLTEAVLIEDPEILQMAKLEQLFRDADDLDHHIIAMLLDHATYLQIADSCYMTESNVKYRVKKYMSICECHTKKELLELLQEYLQ